MHVASSSDESICGMFSGRLKLGITTLTPMPSPVLTFIGGCGIVIGRREEEALMASAVCQRVAACFGLRSPKRSAEGQISPATRERPPSPWPAAQLFRVFYFDDFLLAFACALC